MLERKYWLWLGGAAAIVFALGLRLWGISFGLPYRYHIDETFYVAQSLQLPTTRFDLPVTTHGPNLFYMGLLAEYALYFVALYLVGAVNSLAEFEALYRNDPTTFVLLARITSAIAGMLTLIPIYLTGKRIHGRAVGIGAAVLLASSFQHVRESHYGTPDVLVGLLVAVSLYSVISLYQSGERRHYFLAGLVAGLATGMKFTSGLLWLPIIMAHLMRIRSAGPIVYYRKWVPAHRPLLLTAATFVGAFAIAYPNILVRPARFVEYVRFLIDVNRIGFAPQFIIEPSPAWMYYPFSLIWGFGWLLFVLMVISVVIAIARRQAEELILLAFVVVNLLFLIRAPYYASRYLMPLLPPLCVLTASGVYFLVSVDRLRDFRHLAFPAVLFLALIQPIGYAIRHDQLLTEVDTRTIAKDWISVNIPPGSKVAVDWRKHSPPIRPLTEEYPAADTAYEIVEVGGIGLPIYSLDEYQDMGVDYLVMSSYIDDLALASVEDQRKKEKLHSEVEALGAIFEARPYAFHKPDFVFDQLFGPVTTLWQFERPGPTITIYHVGERTTGDRN